MKPALDLGLPVVRRQDGLPLWRVRVAGREERTHRTCGETLMDGGICYLCGRRPPADEIVRTIDYLLPDEYELGVS